MKRFLAMLLALVMVASTICGVPAFAADGETDAASDTLVVYTKSGATRTFQVGDTFTYTYWLRLNGYSLGQFSAHVLYDSSCLSMESATFPNFPNQHAVTTSKAGDFRFHTAADLSAFTNAPAQLAVCTFKVLRGGTTYVRPIMEELQAEKSDGTDRQLVKDFQLSAGAATLFAAYDRLQNETVSNASQKLKEQEDTVWYYVYQNADGQTVPAGLEFRLTGTDASGTYVERSAATDAYGYLCFGNVPFGNYLVQCESETAAGEVYRVSDDALQLPFVANKALALDNDLHVDCIPASDLRDLTVTFSWLNEEISAGETYTKDRPESLYFELSAGGTVYTQRYVDSKAGAVTFSKLPKYDAAGGEVVYTISTPTLEQYTATATATESGWHLDFAYLNNHKWTTTRVEPTCTENGAIDSVCSDCGATNHTELSALGHDYTVTGREATCTEDGYQLYICKRCGLSYVVSTPALGHDWSDWQILREPTETTDGLKRRACLRCGEAEELAIAGPAHVHTYTTVVVAPTCTEEGHTALRCACGYTVVDANSYVPALGHDYTGDSSTVTIEEPTCTKNGMKAYTCARCGEIHLEVLPAHGHNYGLTDEMEASCGKAGYREYVCAYCGDHKTERVPALGHNWGEWIVDTPATAQTEGSRHRVCKRCGAEQTESIPKLDHTCEYSMVEVVEPNCTERGYTRYKCSCGNSIIDEDSYTEPLGHDWVETFRQESTIHTQGLVQYQCTRCGVYRTETLPKLPGTWKNPFWDVKDSDWFYHEVRYVCQNDLMNGTSQTRFSPNEYMSRAMLVTVLYRMAGEPAVGNLACPFTDLTQDWYRDAVAWAYNCQIVLGVDETHFSPSVSITREQLVTIFYRYAAFYDYDTSAAAPLTAFADAASVSGYARDAMSWAAGAGLINGYRAQDGSSTIRPRGTATRAEAAAILMRFDQWRVNAVGTN